MCQLNSPVDTLEAINDFLSEIPAHISTFAKQTPEFPAKNRQYFQYFFLMRQLKFWVDTLAKLMCQLNSPVDTLKAVSDF